VLVTPAGISKLLDFGASSLLAANTVVRGELTRVMLTPQYASPEQKRGEGPSVHGDIYSLGRLLEEVLSPAAKRSDLRYILERAMAEHPRNDTGIRPPGRPAPLTGRPSTAHLSGNGRVRNAAVPAQKLAVAHGAARNHWQADGGAQSGLRAARRSGGRGVAATPVRARCRTPGAGKRARRLGARQAAQVPPGWTRSSAT
jgi:hypothetical protein